MDIEFPPGLDVEMKDGKPNAKLWLGKNTIFPFEEDEDSGNKLFTHTMASSFGVIGKHTFRMSCISLRNETLTATSGTLLKLYLKATPFVKPGAVKLKVSKCHFTTCVDHVVTQWDCADQELPLQVPDFNRTIPLNISAANQWSTCVLPFSAPLPDGVYAFTVKSQDEKKKQLTLSKNPTRQLEAFTPYILYAPNGYSGSFTGLVGDGEWQEQVQKGVLHGTLEDHIQSEGFCLQNQGDGVKFYCMAGGDILIPAGKCWVELPFTGDPWPEYLSMVWDETTSAPSLTLSDGAADHASPIFTLTGQRVAAPRPHQIYIQNGHKYIQR